ncbi:MAG: aconitase X catalytic domain-containing protein [Candidatus Helarchaeota archaeon]
MYFINKYISRCNRIYLTKDEENILKGNKGEVLAKLLKLLVKLGDSYGANKLIDIKSAHTVLNFGLNFVKAASDVLHDIASAGLKVKVRTTADPILDMDYKEDIKNLLYLFNLQDRLINDLKQIGINGFTCTPYYLDNKPNLDDHCAWSESSAVIYLNSVIGARTNREGGIIDLASAITGKTPNYGLHIKENRKGIILFRILFDKYNEFDLTSIGLKIGEISGNRIPVIEGLKNIEKYEIKNLGAASAATGAVSLIHIIGNTPEAKSYADAFQNDKPEEIIDIDRKSLEEVREKYSTIWSDPPSTISIGCPHLSKEEVISILDKLEGKKVLEKYNLWICCCQSIKKEIINSKYIDIIKSSGVKITTLCPLLTPLPRPFLTNSGKTCFYSSATYKSIDDCLKIATGGNLN